MRLRIDAWARGGSMLATAAVVIPLCLGVASPATAAVGSTRSAALSHFVGGYRADPVRVIAGTARPGVQARAVLPTSVDLRPYAPPVGDQGQIGSCVAWTIGYDIMGYWANRNGGTGAPYAPLFLYLRNVTPGGAPTEGLYPDTVLASARSAGVDTQADYWQGTTDYTVAPTSAQVANAAHYRVAGWRRLFNGAHQGTAAQTALKEALAAGTPVALSFDVYGDFLDLPRDRLYKTVAGKSLGAHMVAAFGYDAQGVWIRNSWGTGWGTGGDAKLSWDFVAKVVSSAYTVSGITTPQTAVVPAPTIGALSADRGAAGTAVTIAGASLADATSVRFDATPAAFTRTVVGGVTRLVAKAPAHAAGVVNVSVTTPYGTSAVGTAGRFTYRPPPPVVAVVGPRSGRTTAVTRVELTGSAFGGATKVTIDGRSIPFVAVSDRVLRLSAPVHRAGPVKITVTTPGGTSPAATFTYVRP